MFTIEKNDLLSTNKLVRYAKICDGIKVTITIKPDIDAEIVRIKIRIKDFPIDNKITFNLIEIPMNSNNRLLTNEYGNEEGLPINFSFNPDIESKEESEKIVSIICNLLEGAKDIILRWIADDGLYFLLKNDASKHLSLLVDAHYRELFKNGQIPENMPESEAKKEIEEQLSEFYCNYISSFEELEPITKLSEVASKNIINHNLLK